LSQKLRMAGKSRSQNHAARFVDSLRQTPKKRYFRRFLSDRTSLARALARVCCNWLCTKCLLALRFQPLLQTRARGSSTRGGDSHWLVQGSTPERSTRSPSTGGTDKDVCCDSSRSNTPQHPLILAPLRTFSASRHHAVLQLCANVIAMRRPGQARRLVLSVRSAPGQRPVMFNARIAGRSRGIR